MRRRRSLAAAVLVVAAVGAAAGVIAARSPAPAARTRSCGILGVGIGWHVSASAPIACETGMAMMRAYFHGKLADRTVLGYACEPRGPGARITCARGGAVVTAVANH